MSQRQDASSGGVRRKVLMTCYFSAAQERALRTLTARTSVPMAVYVGLVLERETTARLGRLGRSGTSWGSGIVAPAAAEGASS